MKYKIITYGCQMNKSDSERMTQLLESLGFEYSNNPDLTIINICSVRQSAVDRAKSKAKTIDSKLLIAGCILQKDKRDLEKISNGIIKDLPKQLQELGFKTKKTSLIPKDISPISANIPIMTGCNNFCAYCVVPHTRGREISRPIKDIVCEIQSLIKKGTKEIWLLGQNVNSFQPSFSELLKKINNIKGDFWIRFTSSHPKDLTKEMIEIMAKSEKVTPYLNLPIQSGDNKILKAMNRPYTVEKYKQLVKQARRAFKEALALSTDVIVGFPNETEEQFNNTKQVFKDIKFVFAYISRYSPRPKTAASKLKDNISHETKKQRERELSEITEKTALEFNNKFLNKEVEVLVLEKKKDFYLGKTKHYQTVKIESKKDILGQFIKTKVINATAYGFEAKT